MPRPYVSAPAVPPRHDPIWHELTTLEDLMRLPSRQGLQLRKHDNPPAFAHAVEQNIMIALP